MIALLLALILAPTPPPPTAYWDSAISATVSWHQAARACLYREPVIGAAVFIGCYDGSGRATVRLGGAQTDGAMRPTVGDTYVVVIDGVTWRVALRGVVLLPLAQNDARPPPTRIRLPLARA